MAISDVNVFAMSAAILYLKFLACTMIQGRKAFAAGTRMAEDSSLPQAKDAPKQGQDFADLTDDHVRAAVEEEKRWKRIIQNDLESMPMAYVVFWSAICVGVNGSITKVLVLVYTVARVGHTIVYAQSLPRARMICWMVGTVCIVIAAVASFLCALF
jgi:glutathione S-transferase